MTRWPARDSAILRPNPREHHSKLFTVSGPPVQARGRAAAVGGEPGTAPGGTVWPLPFDEHAPITTRTAHRRGTAADVGAANRRVRPDQDVPGTVGRRQAEAVAVGRQAAAQIEADPSHNQPVGLAARAAGRPRSATEIRGAHHCGQAPRRGLPRRPWLRGRRSGAAVVCSTELWAGAAGSGCGQGPRLVRSRPGD